MQGRGSVTFGNEWAWQFNTGRGDYLNNTAFWAWGGFDRMLDNGFAMAPSNPLVALGFEDVQWWDLAVAKNIGGKDWGFSLGWSSHVDKETPAGQPATTDESTSMLSFQIGTNALLNADWSLEFGTGSYKDKTLTTAPTDANDFSFTEFALAVRGQRFTSGPCDWRWMVAFATQSASPKAPQTEKYSMTGFRGNFGPVWGTPGDWEVAGYLYFDYMKFSEPYSFGDNSKETATYIVLPGYNFAFEYYITSWLPARASVASYYVMETEKIEGTTADDEEVNGRWYDLYWTVGVGFDKSSWGLDLALHEENFHSGYIFNGDVGGDVFALISAWLKW
jgi:hypothetical protein